MPTNLGKWRVFSWSWLVVLANHALTSLLYAIHRGERKPPFSSARLPFLVQSILLHRYLAVITISAPAELPGSVPKTTESNSTNGAHNSGSSQKRQNGSSGGGGSNPTAVGGKDAAHQNGSGSSNTANGMSSTGSSSAGAAVAAGRARMETNFYVLATACLLLANKSLRARVSSARPRRREELLRAAYGVQFRGRAVEKGTAEVVKWEGKLAAAELEVMVALGFDVYLADPLQALDQQRKQQVHGGVACVAVLLLFYIACVEGLHVYATTPTSGSFFFYGRLVSV